LNVMASFDGQSAADLKRIKTIYTLKFVPNKFFLIWKLYSYFNDTCQMSLAQFVLLWG
jgi:hypothetical protein